MQQPISDTQIVALITACQRGETAGIAGLYDLYADRLYRYLLLRVGNTDVAADLTTELFLRVIQHIGAFRLNRDRPAASVSAWLYRIAANLAAGHFRKQHHTTTVSLEEDWLSTTALPGPEPAVEQREELAHLAQAIAALSEDQRLVISGKFGEGMSAAEIATWLGKTEGAVKSLQHRALRTLARLLRGTERQDQRQPWISYAEP